MSHKPAWLTEAETLSPTVTHVKPKSLVKLPKGIARHAMDDVPLEIDPDAPVKLNRFDRRARRFASRAARRAAFRARTATTKTDPAEVREAAYVAGCRGRVVEVDDQGVKTYAAVLEPTAFLDLADRYPSPTARQARRLRKKWNREAGTAGRILTGIAR